jgi:hypothetical protein
VCPDDRVVDVGYYVLSWEVHWDGTYVERNIRKLEKITLCGSSSFVPSQKLCYNDYIRVEEMGRVCGTHGRYVIYTSHEFYMCVTLRLLRVTIVASERQLALHSLRVCVCVCSVSYSVYTAHVAYCHLCPIWLYHIFPHINARFSEKCY